MSKKACNDMAMDIAIERRSDEQSAREALLQENEVLFDYLHALLTPPPKIDIQSGKISFVYNQADPNFGAANQAVENYASWVKRGSPELKSENDGLKLKIAHLIARLNDTECDLDNMVAENAKLRSTVDYLQTQINISKLVSKNQDDISRIKAKGAAIQLYEDMALVVDRTTASEPEGGLEPMAPQAVPTPAVGPPEGASAADPPQEAESPEAAKPPENEPGPEATEQAAVACRPVVPQAAADSTAVAAAAPAGEPAAATAAANCPIELALPEPPAAPARPEPIAVIAPEPNRVSPAPMPDRLAKKPDQETAAPGRQSVIVKKPVPRISPVSKVIKRQDPKKHRPALESVFTAELLAAPALLEPKIAVEKKDVPLPQPPAAEPDAPRQTEADNAESRDLLQNGVDVTDVETAPTPKAVIKRQMMHYQRNQEEANSAETGAAHDALPPVKA